MRVLNTLFFFVFTLLFVFPVLSYSHAPEQSYIYLRIYESEMKGRFEVTTDDINKVLKIDLQRGLSKEDLEPHLAGIKTYFKENVAIGAKGGDRFEIQYTDTQIYKGGSLGDFIQLNYNLDGVNEIPETLDVQYQAVVKEVSGHQGLLVIEYNWKAGIYDNESIPSLFFSSSNVRQDLPTSRTASIITGFFAMIKLGVWHIWIGIDHILFLFALLLPSVLRSRNEDELSDETDCGGFWKPVEKFRPAFINVLKIVTFFTIAHTITLSLASLEIITLPSRLIESIIAISIALAAIHNIRPIVYGKEWIIAFVFGLFHGFGFASVLAERGFGGDYLVWTLLGFNLGVEVGQFVIVLLIFPVLYFLRKTFPYPKILFFGSIFLILVSIYWFIERAFDINLPAGAYILRALGLM